MALRELQESDAGVDEWGAVAVFDPHLAGGSFEGGHLIEDVELYGCVEIVERMHQHYNP